MKETIENNVALLVMIVLIGSILILYSSCGTSHKSCDGKKKFKTQMNY